MLADETFDVVGHRDPQDVGAPRSDPESPAPQGIAASIRELAKVAA